MALVASSRLAKSQLMLVRPDGWPNAAGRIFLAVGVLVAVLAALLPPTTHIRHKPDLQLYLVEVATLVWLSAIPLLLWRRGVIVDQAVGTLTRWWGWAGIRGPHIYRRMPPRSLSGFTGVRVLRSGETDHFKRWRRGLYHVQLEKSESMAGQFCLRERLIVDDEYIDAQSAGRTGRRLAAFLSLDFIDRTA